MDDFTAKNAWPGVKVLRKEDEEKYMFPVAVRRANSLGLSRQSIVNKLVQHGKNVA